MMLVMAQSEEYIQQLVACEAITAAANKKKDATAIMNQGLEIIKSLYKSKNEHIKVILSVILNVVMLNVVFSCIWLKNKHLNDMAGGRCQFTLRNGV